MQPDFEIWLDNHLSPIIAKWLAAEFNLIVKSAYTLNTWELSDTQIFEKAKQYPTLVIIISKDTDLDEIISIKGTPPKLIKLAIGICSNKILFNKLKLNLPNALKLLFDLIKTLSK